MHGYKQDDSSGIEAAVALCVSWRDFAKSDQGAI